MRARRSFFLSVTRAEGTNSATVGVGTKDALRIGAGNPVPVQAHQPTDLFISAAGSPTAALRGGGGRLPTDCVAAPLLICRPSRATTPCAAIPIVTQVSAGSLPHAPKSSTASTSVPVLSMSINLLVEVSDVSDNQSQGSEKSSVSSAAEMTDLLRVVASPAVPGESVKAVIGRAARRLGWDYGRTRRLYYGEARRIDALEMDRAREVAREREATDRALAHEAADEFRKMGERIARLEALLLSGPYSYGAQPAEVERSNRAVDRALDRRA